MIEIVPPKFCPSCESELEWKKDLLYCINTECNAKAFKALQHWAKTLKIKGLGPKTIKKLNINSVVELYQLNEVDIKEALGSDKLADKLIVEIEKSKDAKLNAVLPAFNIPLIGTSATNKLCSAIPHLDELTLEKARQAGLGPKASNNLLQWFETTYTWSIKDKLPIDLTSEKPRTIKSKKGVICITGKLSSFKTKAEAQKVLVEVGYEVKSSITKDVTIVVNESGKESAKTKKAREAGLEIITNLERLIGEI